MMELEHFQSQYNMRVDQDRLCRDIVNEKYPDIMKMVLDYSVYNCVKECNLLFERHDVQTFDDFRMVLSVTIKGDHLRNRGIVCNWVEIVPITVFIDELSKLLLADGYRVTSDYQTFILISGW